MFGALVAFAIVIGLVVAIVAYGSTLPREHLGTVRIALSASPQAVWAIISDPLAAGSWRKDVRKVEALPDRDGHRAWREDSGHGTITFVLLEATPNRSMITRIDDDTLPFGGQWEYTLEQSGNSTVLAVTERGVVKPALFRFMSRYLFGYTSTMQTYLAALAVKLGENAIPEIVVSGR